MNDCLFCKLIAKEIPASIVYEDDQAMAFLDLHPVRPGHVLVVPKVHCTGFNELPVDQISAFFEVIQRVLRQVKVRLPAEGINLIQNEGSAAGQVVPHLHVHLIPRMPGDGLEPWHGGNYPTLEAMSEMAAKLKF